ncbi:MAG: alpha/beta hydrolase [Betaproteobacteria bacterium]|nr:alpha/beta hydrolase [Betaproteobacteria bacterium]
MLARLSLLVLGLELLLYGLAGGVLVRHAQWRAAWAVMLCLLVAFSVRWGIVLVTFLLAWLHRTPRAAGQRIGALAALRMLWREGMAMFWVFTVLQPLAAWFMPQERLARGDKAVVLVHGYLCNRGVWWWLRLRLERAGWRVSTLNLEPVFGDIDGYVPQLDHHVARVSAAVGGAPVAVVAHSMGGLVVRAWLGAAEGERVATRVERVITLGSPHRGSWQATWGPGRNARQMERGNDWLCRLERAPLRVPFFSVYGVHDEYVAPQDSARLEGARNVAVAGVGHLELLRDEAVARAVIAALDGSLSADRAEPPVQIKRGSTAG